MNAFRLGIGHASGDQGENVQMDTRVSAVFAAAFCLMAASQAKAAVTQTGNLLWTADLPGLQTDASVTPVVISTKVDANQGFSFTNSGATFSGPATTYGQDAVWTGPLNGAIVPGSGLAATTNYIQTINGPLITMTPPRAEGYLGFLATTYLPAYYEDPFNVTLYNGSTALGEITAAQLKGVISAKGYAWINIDVANGGTYTSAVFSSPGITGVVFDISYGTATESLTALTGPVGAPLPALAGTIPGFAVAVLGMLGLRRRGRRA